MKNLLHQNADGTVSKIGYVKAGRISGWRTCDLSVQIPDTLNDWMSTFAAMLGAAKALGDCVADHRKGRPSVIGGVCCPVVCMRLWNVACNKLVMRRRSDLTLARMTLPTPVELQGSICQSFTVMACDYVGAMVDTIVGVVEYKSASMRLPERVRHESEYIAANFDQLSNRWRKNTLSAAEWFSLVELELAACPWLAGTSTNEERVFSKAITRAAFMEACKSVKAFAGGEKSFRVFVNGLLTSGTAVLENPEKLLGKITIDAKYLNAKGIRLP